jgi:hypothetical protein
LPLPRATALEVDFTPRVLPATALLENVVPPCGLLVERLFA